jgi:RNA polymerase sigma factor (sigma-70 family)
MSAAESVLRHIRHQVAASTTDAALLQAYIERHSEDAFRALIQRHGPMVLRVCRRRLDDTHAAEDSFQTTFLTLTRRAKSIRNSESLAGWLFRTAQRIAQKSRAAANRRRKSEGRAAVRTPADASSELTARELLDVMDTELARLPERDRLPLLLVYWQGRSYAQAARELSLTLSALHGRLERGRQRLADRLRSRGFAPGDLGAVLAVSLATAAVPGELLARTAALRAAGAAVPAGVVALTAGSGSMKLIFTAVAVLVVGVGIARGPVTPQRGDNAGALAAASPVAVARAGEFPDSPNPRGEPAKVILEGIVVDEAGQPVVDVQVRDIAEGPHAPVSTDVGGRFRMTLDRPIATTGVYLASTRDGSRQALFEFKEQFYGLTATAKFVLRPSRRISVHVVDERGAGIAGATVVALQYRPLAYTTTDQSGVATLNVPPETNIKSIVAAKAEAGLDYCKCPPDLAKARLTLDGARTARFRALGEDNQPIAGIGLRLISAEKHLDLRAPNLGDCWMPPFAMRSNDQGIAECNWLPATLSSGAGFGFGSELFTPRGGIVYYPSTDEPTIDVKFRPTFIVSGKVTKPDGSPAVGILVAAGSMYRSARTNADGRYSLFLPQNQWQMITVWDSDWTSEVETNSVGRAFDNFDFHLVPGAVVSGRVTVGTPPRPAAGETLNFQLHNMGALLQRSTQLDADGRYSIRLGPAHYGVVGPEQTYIGSLGITNEPSIVRNYHFANLRRFPIEGVIKKPDGSPAAHAEIQTAGMDFDRSPYGGGLGIANAQADANGRFRFIRERVEVMFYAFDPKSGLAAFESLDPNAEHRDLTLKPGAMARLRLIDENGKPRTNTRLYVNVRTAESAEGNPMGWSRQIVTDNVGFATVPGLAIGTRCRMSALAINKDVAVEIAKFDVTEAKTIELGELVAKYVAK